MCGAEAAMLSRDTLSHRQPATMNGRLRPHRNVERSLLRSVCSSGYWR